MDWFYNFDLSGFLKIDDSDERATSCSVLSL